MCLGSQPPLFLRPSRRRGHSVGVYICRAVAKSFWCSLRLNELLSWQEDYFVDLSSECSDRQPPSFSAPVARTHPQTTLSEVATFDDAELVLQGGCYVKV